MKRALKLRLFYCIIYCMMSDLLKKELSKVHFADLNNFNEQTRTFIIPKYSKPKYDVGKMYIVKLPITIIGNHASALATNWNNSTAPSTEYLKVYVSKMVGKMIYVDSVAYDPETKRDLSDIWSGYLPSEEITQVEAL